MTATSASSRGSSSRWAGDWMAPSSVSGSPNICCRPGHVAGVRHVDLAELALEAAGVGLEPVEVVVRACASSAARTWGTPSTAWVAISWRQTHRRRSSAGRLHSSPNCVEVGGDDGELVGRRAGGSGRSYWPNERWARWPTIEPAVMPSMVGPIICISGAIHAIGIGGARAPRRARPARPGAASRRASRTAAGRRRASAGPTACG